MIAEFRRNGHTRRKRSTGIRLRCGLDMTRRDLQGEAKKMGRPWEIGKAFEHLRLQRREAASVISHPASGRTANGQR